MVDNEDIEFREESDYSNEQKISIKEVILRHIRKIGDISCNEFTGGFWTKKPIKTDSGISYTDSYHEDVRQKYCNAIDFLIDIIYPFADKDLKKYLEVNEKVDVDLSEDEIKKKIKTKRTTFREINYMFNRTNFWKGTEGYNE